MKARNKAHQNKFKIRKVAKIKRKLIKRMADKFRSELKKCYADMISYGFEAANILYEKKSIKNKFCKPITYEVA